jgi:hypothetical protein
MNTQRNFVLVFFALSFFLSGTACSTHIGTNIDVPEIPTQITPEDSRARFNVNIAVGKIKDVRSSVIPARPEDEFKVGQFTYPEGEVEINVKNALVRALEDKGIMVDDTADLRLWGEVRRWRTRVHTTSTSSIRSEASIFVEVLDSKNKRIYSSTYHGTRASEFPVASRNDISDSLGLAMAHAIDQLLEDEEFLTSLWQTPDK